MSKKKSYMNMKNIIQEGFIKNFMDYWKFVKTTGKDLSKKDKKILANPTIRKAYLDFMKKADKTAKLFSKHEKN